MKMFTLVVLGLFLLYLWLPTTDIMRVFADDKSNGSTIAGVNVEGLDQKEIENVLLEAINTWLQEDITVTGGGIELTIDPSKLQYDIPSTINEFETLSKKPWYAFWESERVIHIPLKLEDNLDIKNEVATVGAWETDETYNQIMSQASFLMDHTVEAKVKDLDIFNTVRLALSIREIPSSAFAPIELVTLLDGKMINPGEEFSFIEAVKDGSDKVNSETLNFVSSLLYEAVLQTEFEILERHNGIAIPSSIELGKEAIINTNFNEDLKFINTTDYVGKINVSIEGNSMKLEISSNTKGKDVSVRVDKEILNPRIIYRYSSDLPVGQQQMLQEGSNGYRVIVYRTISGNGSSKEQKVSRDYYPPVNEIILKSSLIPETPDETNNNEINPEDLEYGVDLDGDGTPDISISPKTPNQPNDVNVGNSNDKKMEIDLDGDGLPDIEVPVKTDEVPPVYDKAGSEVTP